MSNSTRARTKFVVAKELQGAHDSAVTAIAISLDGRLFASGGRDQHLRLYKTSSAKLTRDYVVGSSVRAIAWHPDPNYITYATEGCVTTLYLGGTVNLCTACREQAYSSNADVQQGSRQLPPHHGKLHSQSLRPI